MPKLQDVEISLSHIEDYIKDHSDFAFELSVYKQLTDLGCECDHGGTYVDSITRKIRQFDIRAKWRPRTYRSTDRREELWLAVECKQLQANFPLVVLTVPRKIEEAVHEVILSVDTDAYSFAGIDDPPTSAKHQAINPGESGSRSIYDQRGPVGKSCAQVGQSSSGIVATDSEAFSKWTQAISSAKELAAQACAEGAEPRNDGSVTILVLPVLVVPNDRLWMVEFDRAGKQSEDAKQVDRCSFWIDQYADCGTAGTGFRYKLSHIEFVTTNGLSELLYKLTDRLYRNTTFMTDRVGSLLRAKPLSRA